MVKRNFVYALVYMGNKGCIARRVAVGLLGMRFGLVFVCIHVLFDLRINERPIILVCEFDCIKIDNRW